MAFATWLAIWLGVSIVSGKEPTRNPFTAVSSESGIVSVRRRPTCRSSSLKALSVTSVRTSAVACQ